MIIPMRKYTFLVHHEDYPGFLRALRQLGVFHVRERKMEDPDEEISARLLWRRQIADTMAVLQRRKGVTGTPPELPGEAPAIVREVRELQEEIERNQQQVNALDKEIAALEPWGGFSPDILAKLQEAGLKIRFFISPVKLFRPDWQEQYALEIIRQLPEEIYFITFSAPGEIIAIDAEEVQMPEKPAAELQQQKEALLVRRREMEGKLNAFAAHCLPALEEALLQTEEETELARVWMNTGRELDEKLMIIEGFVPRSREAAFQAFCEDRRLVYLADRPKPEDNPPVLLSNNRFSRLFEPIGQLYSLPAYAELDLTPFFAPFFMMFFGFCLGDVGYGLIMLAGAGLYKRKAKESLKPVLTLAQFLGGAAILFGALTGTVFGVSLLGQEFSWLGSVRDLMLDSNEVFNLALILGAVQIMFGLALQAYNRTMQLGFKYAVTPIAWLILLSGIGDLYILEWTGPVATYAIWTGIGLILLFNDPDAGILVRFGKGLWELYNITGFFGDLLSYIRLFALGSSSAILGFVINDIALQIKGSSPVLGPIFFILLLVVGHGANLLISTLGSFVHPMRLTFVEFYKNAGFAGGGKAYRPFAAKVPPAPAREPETMAAAEEIKEESLLSKV